MLKVTQMEEVKCEKKKADIVNFPIKKSDGTLDRRYGAKTDRKRIPGVVVSTKMECLYNQEEIISVYNVFTNRINNASTPIKEKVARRNRCMFIAGINLGLRGGDLCRLRWANIFDSDWNYIENPLYIPQKTDKNKRRKEVVLSWSDDFEIELSGYLKWLNDNLREQSISDFIFTSQKEHYDDYLKIMTNHIQPKEWWKIMENTRKTAGIDQKIGTHGLRKTMVHSFIMSSEDKSDALEKMRMELNHEKITTTDKYACTNNKNEIKEGKQRSAFIFV